DGQAIKAGAGALTLTGANAMDWTVQAGTLAADAADFAGDVRVDTGADFAFTAATAQTWGGRISGAGVFGKAGDGVLTLTGDSSGFDGVTEVRGGRLTVNGALGGVIRLSDGAFLGG